MWYGNSMLLLYHMPVLLSNTYRAKMINDHPHRWMTDVDRGG